MTDERLFTPGPTPLPESVRAILGRPIIHHRTHEFETALAKATAGLMRLFDTSQPVLTLSSSGTGGMEALVINLCSPGDTVAVLNGGKFGERWGKIARAYGLTVRELTHRWGQHFSGEDVHEFLEGEGQDASVLFCTHSETSTGVVNDLEGMAKTAREHGKLVVADVVTSLGVHPLHVDAWGVDGAVAGSQKGLMLPPGAAFVTLSEAAWARVDAATLPRFSLDLASARASLNKNSTPFTPAVPLVLGVLESIRLMEDEGLDAVHARHARHAAACQAAVRTMGLELFADRPAHGLTAVRAPEGEDGQEVVKRMREEHGMRIGGGQAPMKGKLFRLGHMGFYEDDDIRDLIGNLTTVLRDLGWGKGDGVAAAEAQLSESVS